MKEWIINNTTVTEERYDSLIKSKTTNKKAKKDEYELQTNHPFYNIGLFTLKKPSKIRCIFYKIKKDGKYYLYKNIKFRVLAETIFDKKDPYKKSLYSIKRIGTCYRKSLDIGCNLENNNIVTAMCDEPFIIPTEPFLHAFVCGTGKDGEEYVLDGTLNIIIEKDIFIKLYNARIISEIDGQKAKNDIELLKSKDLGHSILVHEYLCFPEEVMETVKKYVKK